MPKRPDIIQFKPKNLSKYKGDPTMIFARSSWELSFMRWCDLNSAIVEWSSEEVIIPYRTILDEANDHRMGKSRPTYHRYFVDFYVKVKDRSGNLHKYLVEVKPYKETQPPVLKPGRRKKTVDEEKKRWIINQAKWKAAERWCEDRNMRFKIITEVELYGWKPK